MLVRDLLGPLGLSDLIADASCTHVRSHAKHCIYVVFATTYPTSLTPPILHHIQPPLIMLMCVM